MNPKLRILIRILVIFLLIFLISKPYNLFCNLSAKCQPFYFSEIIPRKTGIYPNHVNLVIDNYRQGLEINPRKQEIETGSSKINKIKIKIKNTSPRAITFRPKLIIEPQEYKEYINFYNCLCSSKIKLLVGEEREFEVKFSVNRKLDKIRPSNEIYDKYGNHAFTIRYRINSR